LLRDLHERADHRIERIQKLRRKRIDIAPRARCPQSRQRLPRRPERDRVVTLSASPALPASLRSIERRTRERITKLPGERRIAPPYLPAQRRNTTKKSNERTDESKQETPLRPPPPACSPGLPRRPAARSRRKCARARRATARVFARGLALTTPSTARRWA